MCGVTRLATPTPLRPHVNAGGGSCWCIDGDHYSHPCGCIRRLHLPPPYRLPSTTWSSPNLSGHAHATLPMLCRSIITHRFFLVFFYPSYLLPLIWFSYLLFIAIEFYIHLLNNISRSQALDITAHTTFLFYYLRSQTMGGVYFRFRFGHPKLLWTAFLSL